MTVLEIVRLVIGTLLLLGGIFIFVLELYGLFKFNYVLDRMHAAAMGDTMGLFLCMAGLCFYSGFNFTTAKIVIVMLFFWIASPVTSHMTALLELYTNKRLNRHLSYEGSLETLERNLEKERESEEE